MRGFKQWIPPDEIRRQSVRDLKMITSAFEFVDWDPRPDLSWMREGG